MCAPLLNSLGVMSKAAVKPACTGKCTRNSNRQHSDRLHATGVVFCIPYKHVNDVRGPDSLGPSASAQGDSYELIAALTRVRGILFGEDFHQFLRGGATQRYSLTTYLDLFCYQPPEHRCILSTQHR